MQKSVHWWGPEWSVQFDIIVSVSNVDFPKSMYNVFQVSKVRKGGVGPRQENIPGVWIINDPSGQVHKIAIQISYIRNHFIYIDYVVNQLYHIEIFQSAIEKDDYWPHWGGKRCVTWPKNNGYDVYVYVDGEFHARKNIENAENFGVQLGTSSLDYECPTTWEDCTTPEGMCTCRTGTQDCPRCPRGPWYEVEIWASRPDTDSFSDEFGALGSLGLFSQIEPPSYPCHLTCGEPGDPDCKFPIKKGSKLMNQSMMILPSGHERSIFSDSNMPEQYIVNMSLFEYAKSLGMDFSHQTDLQSLGPSTESQDIGSSETFTTTTSESSLKLSNLGSFFDRLFH